MKMYKIGLAIIPRRLVKLNDNGKIFAIGWVWLRWVKLTRNLHHGWVCFIEDNPKII